MSESSETSETGGTSSAEDGGGSDAKKTADPTERISKYIALLTSTATAAGTFLLAISRTSSGGRWLLGSTTVVALLCVGALFLTANRTDDARTRRFFRIAAISVASALPLVWFVAFWDGIRFGPVAAHFSHHPAVLIEESVAQTGLPPSSEDDKSQSELAAFVHDLVTEPHHMLVYSGKPPEDGSALLRISGLVTANRFSLELEVPFAGGAKPAAEDAGPPNPFVRSDVLSGLVASSRFFGSAYDSESVHAILTGPTSTLRESVTAAYHIVLAVALSKQERPEANEHWSQALVAVNSLSFDQRPAFPWLLDGILFGADYAVRHDATKRARDLLDAGDHFFPNEPRLQVARSYLGYASGDPADVGTTLASVGPQSPMYAQAETLRGLAACKSRSSTPDGAASNQDPWEAMKRFDSASGSGAARDPRQRFFLHAAAALSASMPYGSDAYRGSIISRHAEKASEIYDSVLLIQLLKGYALGLQRQAGESESVFRAARAHASTAAEQELCDYWHAMGRAAEGKVPDAIALLTPNASKASAGAAVLGLLAELTYEEALRRPQDRDATFQRAEDFAERALKIDAMDIRGNRMMGFYQAHEAQVAQSDAKSEYCKKSITSLQRANAAGGPDIDVHRVMSELYLELAQPRQYIEFARMADELSCQRATESRLGAGDPSCDVVAVERLLGSGDAKGARAKTNAVLQRLIEGAGYGSEEKDEGAVIAMAVAWYASGHLEEASRLNEQVRRRLAVDNDPVRPLDSGMRFVLERQTSCNLAFIRMDQERIADALDLFRRSVEPEETASADCEAGYAVALLQSGKAADAKQRYRKAVAADPNYRSPENIEVGYFWSPGASALARQLVQDL